MYGLLMLKGNFGLSNTIIQTCKNQNTLCCWGLFLKYYLEVHSDLSANLLPDSSLNLLRLKLFSWLQCPSQKRNHQNDSQKNQSTINTAKANRSSIKQSLLTETHLYKQLKTQFQTSRSKSLISN